MKTTDTFKKVIQDHLNATAKKDKLFAETLKKENKNIDDCLTYILNTVKKSGMNGFADDEIFNMAMHYYDEDVIKVGQKISAKVIINQPEVKAPVKKKKVVKPTVEVQQTSLF